MTRNKHDGRLRDPDPSDASWEAFAREHKEELSNIAGSKDARRFERHARKAKEKHCSTDRQQLGQLRETYCA